MSLERGASSATGAIYDLGYHGYDGPRLGRRHAVVALFAQSLRSLYGIGRGGRAKVVPMGLVVLASIPAIVAIGVLAIANQAAPGAGEALDEASPITYESYTGYIMIMIALFAAAQAPELLGRDQRHRVLSLYFSRALRRVDYALARAAGFGVAVLLVILIPQAIIFVGLVLSAADIPAALRDNLGQVPPILAEAAIVGLVFGGLGLLVAAWSPRRAYATATIIGLAIIPSVVVQIVIEALSRGSLEFERADYILLLSPQDVIIGANDWFFSGVDRGGVPGILYVVVGLGIGLVCLGLVIRRYLRIQA